jgi:hypothetical protein
MLKSKNILKYLVVVLLITINGSVKSQQLVNPSFEGNPQVAKSPEGWMPYGENSSPDTQPGAWRVTLPASHGYSYMSMVCRGKSGIDENRYESSLQTLQNPLLAGETYHYSIDLAYSKDFFADVISFDNPVNLRVWGMNELNQKELLWESGTVNNTDWKTYYFDAKPTMRTPYLVLEAYYTQNEKYCGNVLIDNMQYYPVSQSDDVICCHTEPVEVLLKYDTIPTQIEGRTITQTQELVFKGDKLSITVWDHRTKDGDIISLMLNEKTILKEFEISKERLTLDVKVEEGKEYYLTLYAHNLGEIPPNTVALYISDGTHKKFITLSSNLEKCEALKIKIEQTLAEKL